MRVCLAVLLVIPCLASAEEDDPRTLAFKRYRNESIRHVLRSDSAQSEELVIALRGLARHDCAEAARWLMLDILAKRDEGDVQREAIRVLTKYKSPETVAAMADVWEKKFKKVSRAKVLSIFAFGGKKTEVSRRVLAAALDDKDGRVVAAACRSIAAGDDDTFKGDLVERLRHKEPLVRAWAAFALADLAEFDTKPMLFGLFCSDKSNFVRYMAWVGLRRMEKKNRLPCETQAWKEWWEKNQADDEATWGKSFPGKRQNIKAANWFRIPVLADRIIFVIDATQRMEQGFKIDPVKERKKPAGERIPGFFSVKTRYSLATSYTRQVLKQLPDKTEFAVSLYHDKVSPPNHSVIPETRKWLKLSKKTRASTDELLKAFEPGGTSSLYEGLVAAFEFQAAKKPVQKGVQMICFLTNGTPTGGAMKNRPERIMGEVWSIAHERGIVVHTVGIHNHAYALLKDMAKWNNGKYVHAQEEGDAAEPQDLEFWPDKQAAWEAARKKRKKN
ncbi:MAG: HEAT repeat domain-containing protein [Planctomycetota bacterium]|jgi:hypothetical protein